MYLMTNDTRYPCAAAPSLSGETLAFVLPDGGPEALGGTVTLFADDGFELVTLDVSGFLRWERREDTLIITNLPEQPPGPEPGPGPTPTAGLSTDELAAAVVDLMYEVDTMKLRMGGNTL